MQTIKTSFVVIILLGILYGAYVIINSAPFDGDDAPMPPDMVPQVTFGDGSDSPFPLKPMSAPPAWASSPASPAVAANPAAERDAFASSAPSRSFDAFPAPATSPTGQAAPSDDAWGGGSPGQLPGDMRDAHPSGGIPGDFAAHSRHVGGDAANGQNYVGPGDNSAERPAAYAGHSPYGAQWNDPPGEQPAGALGNASPSELNLPRAASNFAAAWSSAQEKLQHNQLADALLVLSQVYDDPALSDENYRQLVQLLDQLAGTVIYSRQHWLEQPYVAQGGETVEQLAQHCGVPAELLMKINGFSHPQTPLTAGQQVKVASGPFRADVNLRRREMTLFLGHYYAGRFPVQAGSMAPQQSGEFVVAEKEIDRAYRYQGGEAGPGDPHNPYGRYWIGLADQAGAAHHICLHGISPTSANAGCMMLQQRDAEDVWAILSIGSRVTVRR